MMCISVLQHGRFSVSGVGGASLATWSTSPSSSSCVPQFLLSLCFSCSSRPTTSSSRTAFSLSPTAVFRGAVRQINTIQPSQIEKTTAQVLHCWKSVSGPSHSHSVRCPRGPQHRHRGDDHGGAGLTSVLELSFVVEARGY